MTGDRVWRMPLFQHYTKQVTDSQLADLNNIGKYSRYVSHTCCSCLRQWGNTEPMRCFYVKLFSKQVQEDKDEQEDKDG